ncbi:MAG TPA: DUF255 domain-containing protein [Bacteroidia bacterium]|jgi:uncharacterized protein YyaL (SSP411 family)|nr:DUF255 domain-containing protein [Bacteroidia bacterium]
MASRVFILFFILHFSVFSQKPQINWNAWGEAPFKKARTEHKPVFLDVGTEWCTACNFMEEETYSDSSVIRILNEHFITIKADAEAQPDVGARFLQWGWPALIFLDSSGKQLWAFQGNRNPQKFKAILEDFLQKYKNAEIKPEEEDYYSPEPKDNSPIAQLNDKGRKQLNSYYDTLYGGWGFDLKIPLYQPVEYGFWLYKTEKKQADRELKKALVSLGHYAKISDRIGGGVYFGCTSGRNWKGAQPEKRSEYQGGVLNNYAEAFLATRDKKWMDEAQLIKKYLLSSMLAKDDSLFYNSQEEYLTAAGNPPGMPPEKYFALPLSERKKYGVPPIDKTLYTEINFRIVKGFLKLYQASQNPEDLSVAVTTAKKIVNKASMPGGWFKTVIENKNTAQRIRNLPTDSARKNVMYLKTQAHAALAMLQLYQFTNDTLWLEMCHKLHKAVLAELYDEENGGFFSTNLMPVISGVKKTQTKVLVENALYARFLIELSDLTGDEKLLKIAEGCIRSVGSDKVLQNEERLIGDFTLATDKLLKQDLVFTIVTTDPGLEESKKLIAQMQAYYHPAKLLKVEKPGHYPDMGRPTLFVCSKSVCSQPLYYSENTPKEVSSFINKLAW